MANPSTDHPNDLRAYLGVLRARKWEILLIAVVVAGSAAFFAFRQRPVYQGHAKVLVRPIQPLGSSTFAVPQAPDLNTERQVIMSQAVAKPVRTNLKDAYSVDALLRNVSVQVVGTTQVLDVGYRSPDPKTAAAIANAFADTYAQYRTQQTLNQFQVAAEALEKRIAGVQTQIDSLQSQSASGGTSEKDVLANQRFASLLAQMGVLQQRLADLQSTASTVQSAAEVIQHAEAPSSPVSPNKPADAVLAIAAGLLLGVAFAFLRERLDDRVKDRHDLEERAGAPVLAVVPKVATWRHKEETRLVMATEPKSPAAEAYRTLATNVLFMAAREDLRVIMVTSSLSGEGKSTTSANLAVALAQSGRKVVLISADLRKPRVARFLGVNESRGLSDVLIGNIEDPWTLMPDQGVINLRVLGSGSAPKNPAQLLSGPRCRALIDGLKAVADLVLIDTPPVLAVADASILSGVADGVIMVVDGEHTKRSAISQTRVQLETAGARILGVVYNNYDANQTHGYPFHYYGYGYDAQPTGGANGASGSDDGAGRTRLGGKRPRRSPSLVGFVHGSSAN